LRKPEEWSRAFAVQAKADLQTYDILARAPNLPESPRLHCLQMACEKLAKAYEYQKGTYSERTQTSHAVIKSNLPLILREYYFDAFGKRLNKWSPLVDRVRHLARDIELLAPAVQGGGQTLENCEYPWPDAQGNPLIPALHTFAVAADLNTPAGRAFLKVLTIAIDALATEASFSAEPQ